MNIVDSLYKLWQSTGIANFIQPVDPIGMFISFVVRYKKTI